MGTYRWKPFTLLVSAEEVEKEVLKIEAGKYYKTRDGRKVGPMRELNRYETDWPWTDKDDDVPDQRYDDKGHEIGKCSDCDLISEWRDEPPSPIRIVTRKEIVPGTYGRLYIEPSTDPKKVNVNFNDEDGKIFAMGLNCHLDSSELREAAHILNQIAEALEND